VTLTIGLGQISGIMPPSYHFRTWIISVDRYLLPLVPFLCILAAVAVVGGVSLLRRFSIPRVARTALIVAFTVGVILPPAVQAIRFNRTNGAVTVSQAYNWIRANVPTDATVVIEARNLVLPPGMYKGGNVRQLRERPFEDYVAAGVDYLVASSQCYGPYFDEPQKWQHEYADYQRLFHQAREVARFSPPAGKPWPELIILKVEH
jgi:hypothetical protein